MYFDVLTVYLKYHFNMSYLIIIIHILHSLKSSRDSIYLMIISSTVQLLK